MRILIIGGTRFIGPYVVRGLAAMGHEVAVFHRGQSSIEFPSGVQAILGNRKDLGSYRGQFRAFLPQVVIDMIPFVEQDAYDLTKTFSGIAQRVVAVSSMDVYRAYGRLIRTEPGEPDALPLTEKSPLREKLYPYRSEPLRAEDDPQRWMDDYDKILVERVVLNQPDLPGTVLRLPAVYGPGDRQHRLFPYLKRMDDRRPVILLGDGVANWRWARAYVENVAAAIVASAVSDQAAGQIYNVAEESALTEIEWVYAIGRAAGWKGNVRIVPEAVLPEPMKTGEDTRQDLTASTEKIRSELGYHEQIAQQEALIRTIAWERNHPPEVFDANAFNYLAEDEIVASQT